MRRLFLLFFPLLLQSQTDSSVTLPLLGVHLAGQMPLGDLANRYGLNLAAGGSLLIKNKLNWVYGITGSFISGKTVKENVLTQLENSDGFVVDNEGYPADLRISERGFIIQAVAGRVLSFSNTQPNSGLLLSGALGYMQHRVRLYDAQQKIAAIHGDLVKGYDRLSAGPCLSVFAGYLYISEHRFVNFYAGIEYNQAFTRSVRKFNYDTGLPESGLRTDGLLGLRFGWILPLYKKKPNEFYYY